MDTQDIVNGFLALNQTIEEPLAYAVEKRC